MKTDRRQEYAKRRHEDCVFHVTQRVERIIDQALEEISRVKFIPCRDLPTKSHVRLADALRQHLIRRLTHARYL